MNWIAMNVPLKSRPEDRTRKQGRKDSDNTKNMRMRGVIILP